MKSAVFLFTASLDHPGLLTKYRGQLSALRSFFKVFAKPLTFKQRDPAWVKILHTVWYDVMASLLMIRKGEVIYIRLNNKMPVSVVTAIFLSRFRSVYLEHNSDFDAELNVLGRVWERRLYRFLLKKMIKSRIVHLAVIEDIRQSLIRFGVPADLIRVMPNGYEVPDVDPKTADVSVVQTATAFFDRFPAHYRRAIFVGNGYAWHGIQDVVALLSEHPNLVILVVGPYDLSWEGIRNSVGAASKTIVENRVGNVNDDFENTLEKPIWMERLLGVGRQPLSTVVALYDQVHFGIGSMAMGILGFRQGSSLKTREYLCFGLPVLLKHEDNMICFEPLREFLFNLQDDPNAAFRIMSCDISREAIQSTARSLLSWREILSFLTTSKVR